MAASTATKLCWSIRPEKPRAEKIKSISYSISSDFRSALGSDLERFTLYNRVLCINIEVCWLQELDYRDKLLVLRTRESNHSAGGASYPRCQTPALASVLFVLLLLMEFAQLLGFLFVKLRPEAGFHSWSIVVDGNRVYRRQLCSEDSFRIACWTHSGISWIGSDQSCNHNQCPWPAWRLMLESSARSFTRRWLSQRCSRHGSPGLGWITFCAKDGHCSQVRR
jgi:hypothetical protein